jgi:hypothetical protein
MPQATSLRQGGLMAQSFDLSRQLTGNVPAEPTMHFWPVAARPSVRTGLLCYTATAAGFRVQLMMDRAGKPVAPSASRATTSIWRSVPRTDGWPSHLERPAPTPISG